MLELFIGIASLILIIGFGIVIWKLNQSSKGQDQPAVAELNKQIEDLNADKRVAEEKITWLNEQINGLSQENEQKDRSIINLNNQVSGKAAELNALSDKLTEQKAEVEQLQEKFRIEFKNLANEILEEKTQKFTEQNKIRLDEILKPLGEKIRDFEKRVEETYDKESKQRFSLEKEIKQLAELNQQISQDANNLTNALKGESKTQGDWGEIILESILEKSGLKRDREFYVQQSYTNEFGKRLQPDVVIAYPGERNVVIDSKVSLTAYERLTSAETHDDREVALRDHLLSIKTHINELNAKNYQDLYELKSLDFVMMFMPIEPAYLVAMQKEPTLWNYAYERRVLLISPTNLIAALRMISNLWRVENQNKNAVEIARQSGDMLDKLSGFVNDILDIGKRLNATRDSYDAALNKLSTGKGNLIRRAEKIKELGAKTNKELPQQLVDESNE